MDKNFVYCTNVVVNWKKNLNHVMYIMSWIKGQQDMASLVSTDLSKQGCHWQPLSVHLWAFCNPPITHDMNDLCVVTKTRNDLQWPKMTYNDLQWPTMTYNDLQWSTMTYNDLQWPTMTYNDLQWSINRSDNRSGDVCINVTRSVYCMTAQMMTASLIITRGDKFTV